MMLVLRNTNACVLNGENEPSILNTCILNLLGAYGQRDLPR